MKAFEFDQHLITTYEQFSRSFTSIRSEDLRSEIDRQYNEGRFWPEALLSLNPRYRSDKNIDELVESGDLDEATGKVFRFGDAPMTFYRHQAEAIAKAKAGKSYVVTTGTGSGKSMCFLCRWWTRLSGPCAQENQEEQGDHRLSDERAGK